jgi:N-acetylmuramoyl-L-alanine amidase
LKVPGDAEISLNSKSFKDNTPKELLMSSDKGKRDIYIEKKYSNNNLAYIDSTNKNNIILLVSKLEKPYNHSVVLDPGHGGEDKGCNIGQLYEKDLNLKIANSIIKDLTYNGCQVQLTRDSDKLLALSEVADFVNKVAPDVFLSIHINYFEDTKYKGISTYYYDDAGFQKEQRIDLSKIIQAHVTKDDGWQDRGIFKDKLKVLRLSKSPCALVECGFLSNSEDRARLTDDKVIANLGRNLSEALMEFLNKK